jgi:hypothetical protein
MDAGRFAVSVYGHLHMCMYASIRELSCVVCQASLLLFCEQSVGHLPLLIVAFFCSVLAGAVIYIYISFAVIV